MKMRIQSSDTIDNLSATMMVAFENGELLPKDVISNPTAMFTLDNLEQNEWNYYYATIGPYQFSICSYKEEGRRFRIKVVLADDEKVVAHLISSPFTIRAKKAKKRSEIDYLTNQRPIKRKKLVNPLDHLLDEFEKSSKEDRQAHLLKMAPKLDMEEKTLLLHLLQQTQHV
eukprot:CAMPEP_0117428958 /NCGR_PEP_ID=MMETSP0758-20121206/8553_1 /TAXON_ID=63605 /ORGANISM="Percolomonas cosmopolitus, Strain AE-1 (ATCC 50343)" /LENGTH=170 /DNA_ID=CAMNT_0005215609 /DNA_START=920 /DNA_END=1432 /DNA_ORIENTATION=+